MKKKTVFLIVTIVLAVVVVFTLLIGGGMLIIKQLVKGSAKALNQINDSSRMLTANEFKEAMEERGFLVVDPKEQQEEQNANYTYIDQVYFANAKEEAYQIRFYVCNDEIYAKAFYMDIKDKMERFEPLAYTRATIDLPNRAKYELNFGKNYMVVSRIGNTILQADVKSAYKEEMQKILEDIQY